MSSTYVVEVGEQDFESAVIERSRQVPVLVDFWAPWCGPCKVLGPALERLADDYQGAFVVAKVNADECPNLAAAFDIRSIPTVHLYVDGQPVDGFMGALPEGQLREFLDRHLKAPAEDDLEEAREALERGDLTAARATSQRVLEGRPDDAGAHLLLARIAFQEGDEAEVATHLDAIPETANEAKDAARIRDALAFGRACGEEGEAKWREKLEANDGDLDARYGLGCCLAAAGRYEDALRELLEVVKRDNRHRDEAARKAMVTIFGLLGPGSDLASEYRRQLVIYI